MLEITMEDLGEDLVKKFIKKIICRNARLELEQQN